MTAPLALTSADNVTLSAWVKWAGDRASWASGGTFRFAWGTGGGREAAFKFTGNKFTRRSYAGPDQGIAEVWIDGITYPLLTCTTSIFPRSMTTFFCSPPAHRIPSS